MTNYSNIAVETTLTGALGTGDLSLTVANATGYPTAPFHVVVDPGSATAEEVMLVTAVVGAVFTVTRAYDGTTAKVHASGATVIHAAIAKDFSGRYTSAEVDALLAAYLLSADFTWANIGGKPTTLAGFGITDAASDSELAAHEADTTSVHGIANTSALVLTNDARLTDARTPTGGAGGVLSGTYPSPGFAVDMATQAELDAHATDTTSVHGVTDTADLVRRASAATAGRVPFWSAGDTISHDAELTYDSTNNRLTVPAIEAPSGAIDISALGSTTDTALEIGALATGDRNAIIDLHSNDTHTDYALRIVRSAGVNGIGQLAHRGTGALRLTASDAAAIELYTSNALRLTIASNGELIHGGTSFPGSPSSSARFFRTDLGFECYYDGTRWLTVHEYSVGRQFDTPAAGTYVIAPFHITYAPYITRVVRIIATSATNNGTNYWTIAILGANSTQGATTTVDSANTSAQSANAWATTGSAPSATATPANNAALDISITATLAPSTLTAVGVTIYYRLIIT